MDASSFVFLMIGIVGGGLTIVAYSCYFVVCRLREARLPEATRYEDLSARLADIEVEHEDKRQALDEANRIIEEADSRKDRLDELKEQIHELEPMRETVAKLSDELAGLNEEVASAEDRRTELDRIVKGLQNDQDLLEKSKEGTQAERDRMEGQRKEAEEALGSLREKRSIEQRAAQDCLDRMHNQIAQSEGDLQRKQSEIAETERRIEAQEKKLARLGETLEETRQEQQKARSELEQWKAKTDGLRVQTASLEQSRIQAGKALDAMSAHVEAVTPAGLKDVASRSQALWEPELDGDRFNGAPWSLDERAALSGLHEQLASAGLIYAPRTLHAFHTSLKVAPDAPLVVLAGISGTGKSQLPRRYAEAMGMHFLSLAVQPGWDSPDDLIGFYNHLEGRFKATPLTRALIQMDPLGPKRSGHGWPTSDSYKPLTNQMLLVLLDEMNLARVEYYFSEFLSRLEQRGKLLEAHAQGRSYDAIAMSERRPAEILLDVGVTTSQQSQTLPLLVAGNVLFCGTMNEDESTQSLSDKVLDRANVLRFAKPERLETQGSPQITDPSSVSLPLKRWLDWCKMKQWDKQTKDRVQSWIDDCNDGLSRIGRPFGHRLGRAMYRYVGLYPDQTEAGLRMAMADQLEQRVLPKLRGADPSDPEVAQALRHFETLVGDLDDEALQSAIQLARRGQEGHFFAWQGVVRENA